MASSCRRDNDLAPGPCDPPDAACACSASTQWEAEHCLDLVERRHMLHSNECRFAHFPAAQDRPSHLAAMTRTCALDAHAHQQQRNYSSTAKVFVWHVTCISMFYIQKKSFSTAIATHSFLSQPKKKLVNIALGPYACVIKHEICWLKPWPERFNSKHLLRLSCRDWMFPQKNCRSWSVAKSPRASTI